MGVRILPPKAWREYLIDWMRPYYRHAAPVFWASRGRDLEGLDGQAGVVTGETVGWTCGDEKTIDVTIWTPAGWRGKNYPRAGHVPGAPMTLVDNPAEEVVVTLAHELRHVDQIVEGMVFDGDGDETDAELYAQMILKVYRLAAPLDKRLQLG